MLYPSEDGGYTVEVPDLPVCFSEGATFEEAVRNVREAAAGHVACLREHGDPIPLPTRKFEVVVDDGGILAFVDVADRAA